MMELKEKIFMTLRKNFLNNTKRIDYNEKIDELDFIKIKIFKSSKRDTIERVKSGRKNL